MIDYEEDLAPTGLEKLGELSELAKQCFQKRAWIAELEDDLKKAKADLRKLEEDMLPSQMREVGMQKFTLDNGATLNLKKDLHMSIPKKNMREVCDWAASHELGPLVRTEFSVDFGEGELDKAQRARDIFEASGWDFYKQTRSVNTSRFKAAIKRKLEAGEDVPLSLMGGYQREYVEIT